MSTPRGIRWSRSVMVSIVLMLCAGVSVKAQAPVPPIGTRVKIDAARPIDFHAIVSPETLYVGQQATYQVGVFLDEEARMRLRRNPEFLPPELRGLLSYELGGPSLAPAREAGGKRYATHVFLRALFPLASGTLTIPPAQLSYALPQSSSYFSREESYVVRAESAKLVVKPLPEIGRPADFSGAVGVLRSSARFDATSARVGDPIVLTLRIQGSGNVKLLPRPTIEVEWASSVPGTERLQVDTSGAVVRGAKEFDWILTPTRAGDVVTPAIPYSYFDPYLAKYQIAEAAPITLSVRTGTLATDTDNDEQASLMPLREHDDGTVPELITQNPLYWLLIIAFPLPALLLLRKRTVRAKPRANPVDELQSITRKLEHPAITTDARERISASTASTISATRKAFIAALAERLSAHPDVLTERARLERTLRRRGVTRETTRDVLALLAQLDLAAFADATGEQTVAANVDLAKLGRDSIGVYQSVDSEALHESIAPLPDGRNRTLVHRSLVLFALLGSASLVSAMRASNQLLAQGSPATSAPIAVPIDSNRSDDTTNATDTQVGATGDPFSAATSAYTRRQFREAADLFHALAIATPRDASALTNWGTAAWAAGDTVNAVRAWQRAARLEPLAADLQQHIAMLPAGARGGIAEIPLIPVNWLALSALACWVTAWIVLAWIGWLSRTKRKAPAWMKVASAVALVLGVSCGAVAVWGALALRSDQLAVVLRPETMREGPAGESNAVGGAATGDIVRVDVREPLWHHVHHADGRVGWLPAQRLITLTDDRTLR